jgi:serine/threonine protein phosphatase PrpC
MEVDRVKSEGGMIFNGRLSGTLAITRAMGDHVHKSEGLSACPSVNKYVLRPFDKYLLVASDGVWDFMED